MKHNRIRKAGGKIISQDEADFEAWAIQQPSITFCYWCPWAFEGTITEGTAAYSAHREEFHSDIPRAKKRRRY